MQTQRPLLTKIPKERVAVTGECKNGTKGEFFGYVDNFFMTEDWGFCVVVNRLPVYRVTKIRPAPDVSRGPQIKEQ